jgi:hypothetical protein
MYQRILPVFILSVLFSCGGQKTSDSSSDSSAVAVTSEASSDTTQEEGNSDGDIFVTDALKDAISGETIQTDTVSEYGTAEQEEHDGMVGPQETMAEVCGFSPDGKYFAFLQVDTGDGYEDHVATVYVIDVAKNEWAGRPATLSVDREDEERGKKINDLRDNHLKKYNITRENMGNEFGFIGVNPNNVVLINENRYVVDFKSSSGMIDLRVKGQDKDILLQKDSKVPASRGVVRRSRLNKAYVLGDRIAVLVEYDGDIQSGFENNRYYMRKNIVVTGVIK